VEGPLDVVADSDGGVLDDDLRAAALRALDVPRARARARALKFDWDASCREFAEFLVPARAGVLSAGMPAVTEPSPKVHKLVS